MQKERLYEIASQLLTLIEGQSRPANEILNAFFREHKSLGSKPRRFLSDTVWHALRHKARITYLMPQASWQERLERLEQPLPDLSQAPFFIQMEVPEWLIDKIPHAQQELPALLKTPDIILRTTIDRDEAIALLKKEGVEAFKTKLSPFGLVLKNRVNLNNISLYKEGLIEVQDEASQLVALETGITPDRVVLDYCAGAGGKTLIFAQMMKNQGKIVAHDVSKQSLNELIKRTKRAQIDIVETVLDLKRWQQQHTDMSFSDVVVDAPCSGTGTWRRCPDARWKLTPQIFNSILKKQAQILNEASLYVAHQGNLFYMTCSLSIDENIKQVQAFLKTHKNFQLKKHCQFSPYRTNTDGLFIAVLNRLD